jgi:hypothetical protein
MRGAGLLSWAHRNAFAVLRSLRAVRWTMLARSSLRSVRRAVPPGNAKRPDPVTRRRIRRYARDVLGSARYRYWLTAYTLHHGGFRDGWLPDDHYGLKVLPAINSSYRNLSSARTLTRGLLRAEEFPDLAYRIHGQWYDPEFVHLTDADVVDRCFPNGDDREVVVKSEDTNQGRGVQLVRSAAFEHLDLAALGNAVVQARVEQHPVFEAMVPGCTATVRVTTLHHGGQVRTVAAYLRVGRSGEQSVRSATHLRIPVIDTHGTLGAVATAADWSQHAVHPDTGVSFAGVLLPGFAALRATCERLHARTPQSTIFGWDGIVDPDGRVALFEWNTDHPDIKFTEASLGPGFAGLGFERL